MIARAFLYSSNVEDKRMNKNNVTASYVRVSTTKESQKDSPEHQKMDCEERALKEGLEIVYTYEDRSSGTNIVNREDIQKMLKDATDGLFNTIIFSSISRFSRDQLDALTLKRMLVDALGIRIIAIDENYDSLVDKDELKFTLYTLIAQQQAEQISLSTRRGKRMAGERGNFTGAIAPYGYDKYINEKGLKSLKPNDKAQYVKLIFDLYVNGSMGEKNITSYLNEQGIPSPKGGLWGITTIQSILKNEAYTGRNVYNKYEVKKAYDDPSNVNDRKKRQYQRDKEKWLRNEEKNWEGIIDDKIFTKATEIRQERGGGKRGGVRNKVNLFAGFIKCGHCGSSMVCLKSKNGRNLKDGRVYRHLVCSRRRRLGELGCDNNLWLPYFDFRDAIIEEVSINLRNQIDIEQVLEESKDHKVSFPTHDINKERTTLEKQLDINRKLLFELRKQKMMEEIDEEQYQYEKGMYEAEIKKINTSLTQVEKKETQHSNEELLHEEVRKALEELANLSYDNFDEMHLVLKKIMEKIVIFSDGNVEVFTPLGEIR